MKTAIVILILSLVLTQNVNGQKQFSLIDTAFEVGQVARFDINYDLSRHCPVHESMKLVDSIVAFLKINRTLFVEFSANWDYRGSSSLIDTITKWSARCLREYCTEKGIDPSRCTYRGYGKNQPEIVDNEIHNEYPFLNVDQELNEKFILGLDNKEKQEVANKLNRRTEIKIIKINNP